MMKIRLLCWTILIFCFVYVVNASEISVNRECAKAASIGSIIQINITVKNNANIEKNIRVEETVGVFDVIEPNPIIPAPEEGMIGLRNPYFQWNFTLLPNTEKTVYYKFKVVAPGDIILSPTEIYVNGDVIYTDVCVINILCNQNKKCELELGENYFNCPKDCPSGSADGICDLIKDKVCDPDCEAYTDFDCHCGNGKCEVKLSENITNCPEDCKEAKFHWSYLIILIIIIIVTIAIFLSKKRGGGSI
ncbi:MAG: hypothetical protein QXQ40_02395 [Candidatus Aenigmatarchaeota archaeon]